MKGFELLLNGRLLRYGFWPLIITLIVVLIIIIITTILVRKEIKRSK